VPSRQDISEMMTAEQMGLEIM